MVRIMIREMIVARHQAAIPVANQNPLAEDYLVMDFGRANPVSEERLARFSVGQLDEPLVSDRPDFTEASSVVGLGVFQIESGYTYTYDNNGTNRSIGHSYPETLLRYGVLADWLEFRFGTNYSSLDIDGLYTRGAEDIYTGFKIGLTPQEGWRPEMALMPQITVPSGSRATTSGEVLAGLNWLYGWDLSERISTAGSTQFNRALDETTNASYTEWAQSWTVGYGLAEKLGGYTEYFGFYPAGADTARVQHYFDAGLTYSLTNNVQWDIRGGKGLNSVADDYFVGTGLVLRFY
jgi:Putative MetA-pathway of phenol degradation